MKWKSWMQQWLPWLRVVMQVQIKIIQGIANDQKIKEKPVKDSVI